MVGAFGTLSLVAGCLGIASADAASGSPGHSVNVISTEGAISIVADGQQMFVSPKEGLWSVATDWADGWPAAWVHGKFDTQERSGDWLIISGTLNLPSGDLKIRDSYRIEEGLVHGIRRWTWTGKQPLKKCTLSVRWSVPGATHAKPLLPGILIYGNPAGAKTGNHAVAVHSGAPGERSYFEEHRFAAPYAFIEWKSGEIFRGAALHTVPCAAFGANQNDQWWTLGLTSHENSTELACLSGPPAANGRTSVVKALQDKFLEYPDTWINLAPGAIVEKSFYLEAIPKTDQGSGFRTALATAMRLHPVTIEGLPSYKDTIDAKYKYALSRFRDHGTETGFEMYPEYVKGTHYVMGWCGQAEGGGNAMLSLAKRIGDPKMLDRAQRSLDWLTHSPFNAEGFLVNYNLDKREWSDQDPVSQGQAMEVFARAISIGRKTKGVNTALWEAFLEKACAIHAKRILSPNWKPYNTAEAFLISPLSKASQLFHNLEFEHAAIKAAEYYAHRHLTMEEPYWGGTLDASCEDKEGAWAAFQAFLAIYELHKDPKYLAWASHAMDATLSYTVLWDIDLPAGRLRDHGLKTRGWTIVSAQNQHLDVFGVVFTPEIWRMGEYLHRPDLKRLATAMFRSCGQMVDPFGSQGEQIQHTNFAQQGDMSNVFRLRGGYSETWTVFWITAHFLTAASEFEAMGVDLDRGH